MKKVIVTFAALFAFGAIHAEDTNPPIIDGGLIHETVNICGMLTVMYIIVHFILNILQRNLDYRIKTKVIEAHTPEDIVKHVLQPSDKKKGQRKAVLQWICVLFSIGVGLSIIKLTMPVGLHSVAILAFAIAVGLLAYYLLSGRMKKDDL